MLDLIVRVTRIGVIVFWFAFVLGLLSFLPAPFGQLIVWVGFAVLVIHLVEYLYARYLFKGLDKSQVSFVQTLLFGFTHLFPLVNDNQRDE